MSQKLFQQAQVRKPKRNKFDLSHEKKMSLQLGKLVPIFWKEALPGDTFKVDTEIMLRLAPMLAPIMHRVDVYTHYFKVPNRLIWNEWEDYITGGKDGLSAPVHPYINATTFSLNPFSIIKGNLPDYLGLPIQNMADATPETSWSVAINALPFRAYQEIYNEYYRDPNLSDPIEYDKGSGEVVTTTELNRLTLTRERCWEKDYLTSALPWPQRGAEMLLPMTFGVQYVNDNNTGVPSTGGPGHLIYDNTGQLRGDPDAAGINFDATIVGDNATTTINDLRTAVKIQQWLEANARGGARYIEQILSHFGVKSSDSRLQRPEYLGGGKQAIRISEVLSTVEGTSDPQGNMAGHGISAGKTNGFTTYCEEHCIIMGIMSVMPKTAYYQGISKELLRTNNKFEYAWPELAHLGEQEVHTAEVYFRNDTGAPLPTQEQITFGYQERYAEYKYAGDSIHGDFRTTHNYWHMGRDLDEEVGSSAIHELNEDFVACYPTDRIFAVQDGSHPIWAQIYHHVDALRPLPYFGTPKF